MHYKCIYDKLPSRLIFSSKEGRMKECIGAVISVFLALLLPFVVFAEEDFEEPLFQTKAIFAAEYNLLDSGNSRIFAPSNDTDEPIKSEDRSPSRWRTSVQFYLTHDYVELQTNFFTASRRFGTDSVGGEITLLFPIRLIDGLKLGYYHESTHNVNAENAQERFGAGGTNLDGIYVSLDLESDQRILKLWATWTYNMNKSPYFFTKDAREMNANELGRTLGRAGFELKGLVGGQDLKWQTIFNVSDNNRLASVGNRLEVIIYKKNPLDFVLFGEYNRNLERARDFGQDEWQIGPRLAIQF